MDLFERGCPKILTWAPLPKHQALCNLPVSCLLLRCSRDNFPQFGVGCLDHSHALDHRAKLLFGQRNLGAREDRLLSKLCLSKITRMILAQTTWLRKILTQLLVQLP